MHALSPPSAFATLARPGRLLVAACRAGLEDLRASRPWEEGELLALCDAAGLRRCAAARLGAFVLLLLREARGGPIGIAAPGSAELSAPEMALAAAVAGPPPAGQAARRQLAGWMPPARRVQLLALLMLAAEDLECWAKRA